MWQCTKNKYIRNYRAQLQEKIAASDLKNGDASIDVDHVVGNLEIDIAVKI